MKIKVKFIIEILLFGIFLGVLGLENYFILSIFAILFITDNIMKYMKNSYLCIILFFHAIIYYINYSSITLDWLAKNMFNPIILFIAGYWLTLKQKSNKLSSQILILGLFLHGALNTLIYIKNPVSMVNREFINIWGGTITATLHSIFFIAFICLLFYAMYIVKNKILKIFIILGIVLSVYSTIISASRTLLFLLGISFVFNLLLSKRNINRRMNILISVCIIITILIIFYHFNIIGIRTLLETSNLGERLLNGISKNDSITQNIRWEMSSKILKLLPTNPFGKIIAVNYAHNLFLDIAKYTGIFPAIGIFIWSIYSIYKYLKYVVKTREDWDIILASIGMCMMLVFFLEPIVEGLPIAFSAYCYLCGIFKGSRVIHNKKYKGEYIK